MSSHPTSSLSEVHSLISHSLKKGISLIYILWKRSVCLWPVWVYYCEFSLRKLSNLGGCIHCFLLLTNGFLQYPSGLLHIYLCIPKAIPLTLHLWWPREHQRLRRSKVKFTPRKGKKNVFHCKEGISLQEQIFWWEVEQNYLERCSSKKCNSSFYNSFFLH